MPIQYTMNKKTNITIGSLFAGIGGIEQGFLDTKGYEVLWANEIDTRACKTYKNNFDHKLFEQDVKKLNTSLLQKIDVLTGGFPCQAFSIAGYQKGFRDERGNIFFEILRFLDELHPRIIFLENVKNLQNHDSGRTFSVVKHQLEDRGYHLKYKVLNSAEYGNIPQNRERIYIVGFRNKNEFNNFEFPQPIQLTKTIQDFLDSEAEDKYYYNDSKYYSQLKQEIKKTDTIYQLRRVYVRENKNKLCPTLTANMGTGGHNVPLIKDTRDIRKLTPRECARFQGFPDSFILDNSLPQSALYKQIGNSVSIPVISVMARQIKKAIYPL